MVLCFLQISALIVRQNLIMILRQWNVLNTTAFHEAVQLVHVWRTSQFYKKMAGKKPTLSEEKHHERERSGMFKCQEMSKGDWDFIQA